MKLHVGTSGFSYKEWKGYFYPEDLPNSDMLHYYAERLNAVEINNTHYKFPTPKSLTPWLEQVSNDFQFTLKAPQVITHFRRLKEVGDQVRDFVKASETLKDHLGALLFQLPPNMKKDLERLGGLFEALPAKSCVAMEFRHMSW